MSISTAYERHMYEADIVKTVTPRTYQRRDCIADGNCERPASHHGMCSRHWAARAPRA